MKPEKISKYQMWKLKKEFPASKRTIKNIKER